MARQELTEEAIRTEAVRFAAEESELAEPSLYGVTDGKAVGTYLEQKFRARLATRYVFREGNSAKGIDFPDIGVDIKVTSFRQPQSSCPFKSPRQKVFGLGYSLLVFVYEKVDDALRRTARLDIKHTIFVNADANGDYTMTRRLREMVADAANIEDIVAFLGDRNLPLDDIGARELAKEIFDSPPRLGYLTISNALQWRLQYGHAIAEAGLAEGVLRLS
ncbi:MAG: restriction endonuclease [Deltaproteobacteria bacterium]|nr:restriction endonuclease [Deltaproteobacteria bacterium]